MELIIFILLMVKFASFQYQQTMHLNGRDTNNQDAVFGITNVYDSSHHVAGTYFGNSFYIDGEIAYFFGKNKDGVSDQHWMFSLEKKEWKFVKGRKEYNQNPILNRENNFDEVNQIGGRFGSKAWINQNKDLITFFGGFGLPTQTNLTSQINLNEIWRYNITNGMYSVEFKSFYYGNNIDSNIFSNFQNYHHFDPSYYPSGRRHFGMVQIDEFDDEVLVIGGYGNFNDDGKILEKDLDDLWIYSTVREQWKCLQGSNSTYNEGIDNVVLGIRDSYDSNTTFIKRSGFDAILVNSEEVLIFGGFKGPFSGENIGKGNRRNVNIVQKYNISSNKFKFLSGSRNIGFDDTANQKYDRNYKPYDTLDETNNVFATGRSGHKLFKINSNEVLLFGGIGNPGMFGMLNNEFRYNLDLDVWKFSGKTSSKMMDRRSFITQQSGFQESTQSGGIYGYIGHFIPENKELIVGLGYGHSQLYGFQDNLWLIYLGNICFTLKDIDPEVCSGKGKCTNYDTCECEAGRFGPNCELTRCGEILSNETEVCSNKGICIDGKCICFEKDNYINEFCAVNEELKHFMTYLWVYITIPSVIGIIIFTLGLVVFFAIVVITKQRKRLDQFNEIEDVHIILEEQKLSKNSNVAHFKINQKMFEIDVKDIQIEKKIGQGGGSAVVFGGIWNETQIAYKCFTINDYMDDEKYKEFEKEVEILGSISFPHILKFYGATLSSKRLGFVMEYAENGDLDSFLKQYKKRVGCSYSFKQKLRMLREISAAMVFLHSKKIIHRDLKLHNVLVTEKEETRVTDFGVSKIFENENDEMTAKVGTSIFMAPEVLTKHYSFPADVFSFSILMYVVLTEKFSPFGSKTSSRYLERKISQDVEFRPKFDDVNLPKDLIDMMKKNWNHDPKERMSFNEICSQLKKREEEQGEEKEEKSILQLENDNENLKKRNKILYEENKKLRAKLKNNGVEKSRPKLKKKKKKKGIRFSLKRKKVIKK